jgi:predicted SnoaL-like aldol condensation-catalyzing enzyme
MKHSSIHCALLFVVAATLVTTTDVRADQLTGAQAKALCSKGDSGPKTVYGETPEEAANKKVVFDWNCQMMVRRDIKGAFANYVSKDWCDYGHMVNQMKKLCGTADETMVFFTRFAGKPLADTDTLEFPTQATVNGPMVTMYGAGVDIFEVRNGKIVAHYDASPTKAVAFKDKGAVRGAPGASPAGDRGSGPSNDRPR